MTCPLCKLENPGSARVCDCGYSFATGAAPSVAASTTANALLRSMDRSLRAIKFVVVAWAVLTLIGLLAWLLRDGPAATSPQPARAAQEK